MSHDPRCVDSPEAGREVLASKIQVSLSGEREPKTAPGAIRSAVSGLAVVPGGTARMASTGLPPRLPVRLEAGHDRDGIRPLWRRRCERERPGLISNRNPAER